MADRSGIEWTDATWNPLVGCEWASAGCDGCYAARDAATRLSHTPAYAGLAARDATTGQIRFTGEVRARPELLDQPSRWTRPRRIFVCSTSDMFHPASLRLMDGAWPFLARMFAEMVANPRHTFQILTKRSKVMAAVLREPRFRLDVNALLLKRGHPVMRGWMTDPSFQWPRHMWFGTSVESAETAWRAVDLAYTASAAVRFISAEPLIGRIDPTKLGLEQMHWLIAGGESGPNARACHPDWVRELRDACGAAGVAFFFKQWGEWQPMPVAESFEVAQVTGKLHKDWRDDAGRTTACSVRVGKKQAGRELDGCTWSQYPGGEHHV